MEHGFPLYVLLRPASMLEEPLDVGHMFRMVPQTLFMDGKPDAKVNLVSRAAAA